MGHRTANAEPQREIDETCTQQQLVLARLGFERVGVDGGCSVQVTDRLVESSRLLWTHEEKKGMAARLVHVTFTTPISGWKDFSFGSVHFHNVQMKKR